MNCRPIGLLRGLPSGPQRPEHFVAVLLIRAELVGLAHECGPRFGRADATDRFALGRVLIVFDDNADPSLPPAAAVEIERMLPGRGGIAGRRGATRRQTDFRQPWAILWNVQAKFRRF